MEKSHKSYLFNIVIPAVIYSSIVGVVTGAIIFFYKIIAEKLSFYSSAIYAFISGNLVYIPLFLIGLVLLAIILAKLIRFAPQAKGGGIPTSEGIIRGLITFKWLRTLVVMIVGSFISFFAGLPLGTEGPSVQIGTSLGKGTNRLLSKNKSAWSRYVMTGGAAAGFAVATLAPFTAILFALEEIHKKFTPMLVMVSFFSVLFAIITNAFLSGFFSISLNFFEIETLSTLPLEYIYLPLLMGVAIGLFAIGYSLIYKRIIYFCEVKLEKVSRELKLVVIFLLVGVIGLFCIQSIGSGHSLIENILEGEVLSLMLLLLLVIKVITITFANGCGATGGMFIPLLTLGAICSGLIAKFFVFCGMSEEMYQLFVVIGICAYLGATLRAPLTAVAFGIETLGGSQNALAIALAVILAYLILEMLDVEALYDIVLRRTVRNSHKDVTSQIYDITVEVQEGAFIIGKQVRDVLWPAHTIIMDVKRCDKAVANMDNDGEKKIKTGDSLHLRYQSYNNEQTLQEINDLVKKC